MRTIEQLRARCDEISKQDFFGFETSDLALYDVEKLKPEHKDSVLSLENAADIARKDLIGYLPFAFNKALNHRGLSASRSISHIRAWLWLMERDDLLAFANDESNYRNYGMPILKRMAREFGMEIPPGAESWVDGEACHADCHEGCNS